MADFYADVNVPVEVIGTLRDLGHDVLRIHDDPDMAITDENDRWDFHRLHRVVGNHAGIVTYTEDDDPIALADRIHAAITALPSLAGQLVRITRPA